MARPSLAGSVVLEAGGYLAAPFAGRMLTQLGAKVIKIEPPAGDLQRIRAPGTFLSNNAGKWSFPLDLKSADGRSVFERLLQRADVLLHNLSPSAVRAMKLGYADCRRVNPTLIYCRITGYGPGPLENELASNPLMEASMGLMFATRVDGRPIRRGPSFYDFAAGANAVIGILAAMMAKTEDDDGRGLVEVPLYETALYLSASGVITHQLGSMTGAETPRAPESPRDSAGPTSEFSVPGYGAYETSDRKWIFLGLLSDGHWHQFCEAMSLADADDPSLALREQRIARRQYVEDFVTRGVRSLTLDQIAARLATSGIGFAQVKPIAEVLDHVEARQPGRLLATRIGDREIKVPNFPILSESVRADASEPAPRLGEHTVQILEWLGYEASEQDALLARGVVRRVDD